MERKVRYMNWELGSCILKIFQINFKLIEILVQCNIILCNRNNDSKQSREALKKHSMVPHKFPCKSCSLRFPNKAKLEAHFLENHVNAAAKHNDCSICGNHFSDPKVHCTGSKIQVIFLEVRGKDRIHPPPLQGLSG